MICLLFFWGGGSIYQTKCPVGIYSSLPSKFFF
jgi:hypothetical protein